MNGRSPKKDRIPLPVREAIYRFVQDHGAVELARKTGTSSTVIGNKANPDELTTPHLPTVADVLVWQQVTNDHSILRAEAYALGEVCFPLPDLSGVSDACLIEHLAKIGKEGGDFYRALGEGLNGKRFKPADLQRIRREANEWIAAIHEGCARMEGMVDA